jgi:oxygen-independent coproporphyrinogen-3 oxidase
MDQETLPEIDPSLLELQPEPATSRNQREATDVGSVFVSNYPPFSQWTAEQLPAYQQALDTPAAGDAPPLGLYLHIPFCRKRCKFCYFRVYTDKNADEVEVYCDALAREIDRYASAPAIAGRPLRFVYFGGGTPSYIAAKHLRELVARVRAALPWDSVDEVTFECEPGTLTKTKLETVRELGITRLSLGVENFNDEILESNGRAHVSKEIFRVLPWIRELEFDQLNIDLIAGMIGETWETWRDTVQQSIDTGPDSVTVYQMELPYNTRFSKQFLEGTLDVPLADWALKREWHDYAFQQLEAAGFEISSAYTMVRADKQCDFVYRDALWHGADMLGTGVSSFGHLNGVHAQNTASWANYLEAVGNDELPLERAFVTSSDDRLIRETILQLKTGALARAHFADKFNVDVLEHFAETWSRLQSRHMLRISDDGVELTRQGLLQADALLPEFYAERYRDARYT